MDIPAPPSKRANIVAAPATDVMSVLSAIVEEQVSLIAEQRDTLARLDRLMTELVQARSDGDGGQARGSTVVTFTHAASRQSKRAEP
jgi:hypothetical protein